MLDIRLDEQYLVLLDDRSVMSVMVIVSIALQVVELLVIHNNI